MHASIHDSSRDRIAEVGIVAITRAGVQTVMPGVGYDMPTSAGSIRDAAGELKRKRP